MGGYVGLGVGLGITEHKSKVVGGRIKINRKGVGLRGGVIRWGNLHYVLITFKKSGRLNVVSTAKYANVVEF